MSITSIRALIFINDINPAVYRYSVNLACRHDTLGLFKAFVVLARQGVGGRAPIQLRSCRKA